jgi:hypothetical protein
MKRSRSCARLELWASFVADAVSPRARQAAGERLGINLLCTQSWMTQLMHLPLFPTASECSRLLIPLRDVET